MSADAAYLDKGEQTKRKVNTNCKYMQLAVKGVQDESAPAGSHTVMKSVEGVRNASLACRPKTRSLLASAFCNGML